MTNSRAANFRYFVSPDADGGPADGSSIRPLATVRDALAGIAERHGGTTPKVKKLQGYDRVDICSIARPSARPQRRKSPRYQFVDPLGTSDINGEGTALFPWPDLESALAGVARLDQQGAIPLAPGEHLTLSVREVFSATPVDRKKRRQETIARYVFLAMTLLLVVPLAVILIHLTVKAWPVLSLSFVFDNPRNNMTAGGVWAPLVGTFYLVFISLLVAAPIGILAGVYLNEYARDNWFNRIVNLAVVNLAGVPSIVHALFGVGAFVMFAGMGESVLAASCTLAIMTLPVIISSTKEALASVPMTFREACWNMGASRWQTIRTIVLPNSISGILTGVILQVSRAAGETAPILFTGAAYSVNVPNKGLGYFFPYALNKSCMALSYHLHVMLTQVNGASPEQIAEGTGIPLEQLQYGTAVVLIGLVLLVNSASIGLRVYLRSRKKWQSMASIGIDVRNLSVAYGTKQALRNISLEIPPNQIFGIIGPANSGKTTLLKCINRTIDFVTTATVEGQVLLGGQDVREVASVFQLRRRIGMVFPLPVGLPLSVYDNVAYGPRMAGLRQRGELDALVEKCLRQAALWDEVKDRLNLLGTKLSGGQQQRLTLARALSLRPDILCLDEFSIAIDPVTTMKIEEVLLELRGEMTIVLVTNLVQQARRLAQQTAFFNDSRLVEVAETKQIFTKPAQQMTYDYVTGKHRLMATQDAPQYSIETKGLNLWYGDFQALKDIEVHIRHLCVTSLIGPSGCGKTSLLRCFNRINERYGNVKTVGEVSILNKNIYDPDVSLAELRKTVGMVFQRPNPLPISIYENVLFGLHVHTQRSAFSRAGRDELVCSALEDVFLWKDVKDKLHTKATLLTLEQQQKLCIARLLPLKPRVILMDEPCSALDAEGTQAIESLIDTLREKYTIVIVTHNMGQAARASEECIYMLLGKVVEHGKTQDIFLHPQQKETEMYIEGRYG